MANSMTAAGFLSGVPVDPINSGDNMYLYVSNGTGYTLKTVLEQTNNSALENDIDINSGLGCNCQGDPVYCVEP
jgi:hypothetical protein